MKTWKILMCYDRKKKKIKIKIKNKKDNYCKINVILIFYFI